MAVAKVGIFFCLVTNYVNGEFTYHQKRFKMSHQDISDMYLNITGQIRRFSEILEDPSSYTMPDVSKIRRVQFSNHFPIVF